MQQPISVLVKVSLWIPCEGIYWLKMEERTCRYEGRSQTNQSVSTGSEFNWSAVNSHATFYCWQDFATASRTCKPILYKYVPSTWHSSWRVATGWHAKWQGQEDQKLMPLHSTVQRILHRLNKDMLLGQHACRIDWEIKKILHMHGNRRDSGRDWMPQTATACVNKVKPTVDLHGVRETSIGLRSLSCE